MDSPAVWICFQEVSRIAVFYRLISKKIKFPFVVKELSPTLKENINKTANTIALSKNCRSVPALAAKPGEPLPGDLCTAVPAGCSGGMSPTSSSSSAVFNTPLWVPGEGLKL